VIKGETNSQGGMVPAKNGVDFVEKKLDDALLFEKGMARGGLDV